VAIRDRLRRLRAKAEEGAVVVRQRDGSLKVFETMTVFAEMFLAKMDLLRDTARESEVLVAVRNATPESRAAFEERFGSIAFTEYVIAAPTSGGWVEVKRLTQDGEVLRVRYEGDSEEATSVRDGVRLGTFSELPDELSRPPVAGQWVDEPVEDLSEYP
jgi:hypothetical protein